MTSDDKKAGARIIEAINAKNTPKALRIIADLTPNNVVTQRLNIASLLRHAIVNNADFEIIEELVKKVGDVNMVDQNGITPLMLASMGSNEKVVKLLLDNGAEINDTQEQGWTALMLASQEGHVGVVGVLLNFNPDLENREPEYGRTALLVAANKGHTPICKLLIEKGTNVNAVNEFGWTALLYAATDGNFDLAELLLENNANVNKGNTEDTPLSAAVKGGYAKIVELILRYNVNLDSIYDATSPCMISVDKGTSMEALSHGHGNPEKKCFGPPLPKIAIKNGQPEIARMMEDSAKNKKLSNKAEFNSRNSIHYENELIGDDIDAEHDYLS